MLKKFWYQRSLNAALLELGIETTDLNRDFHDEVLAMGLRDGLTPKEAALSVLSAVYPRLSLVDRLNTIHVVRKWRESPHVREVYYQQSQEGVLPFVSLPALREK